MKKPILYLIALISLAGFINAQNPQWKNYTYGGDNISSIAEEDNNIWAGTEGGLVKFDKTTGIQTFYNLSNSGLPGCFLTTLVIDESGNKWIGTYEDGLTKFNGTDWITYNTENSGLPSEGITSIAIDGSEVKWIGTDGGGLTKFDGTDWTSYNTENSGLPSEHITSIAIDGSEVKWIGTDWGLAKFDGTNWTTYNTSNSGLPDNCVSAIL